MPRGKQGFQKGLSGYWKGKKRPPFSEEWKKKMGESRKGNKNPAFGKHYPNSGFKEGHKDFGTPESHKRQSEKMKGKIPKNCLIWKGKNHPFWKGGITPKNKRIKNSIEYRLWREAVFARDNWTCQECKTRGCVLHAHHIKRFSQFPELRFAIDNGITLCENCHKKTNTYGNIKYKK